MVHKYIALIPIIFITLTIKTQDIDVLKSYEILTVAVEKALMDYVKKRIPFLSPEEKLEVKDTITQAHIISEEIDEYLDSLTSEEKAYFYKMLELVESMSFHEREAFLKASFPTYWQRFVGWIKSFFNT